MKKFVFYRSVISRPDKVKDITSEIFLELCSWPRLLLEVFTRKNFGVRYFNLRTAILLIIALAFLPLLTAKGFYLFASSPYYRTLPSDFYLHYATWYLYLVVYFVVCLKRHREISRRPGLFDFNHYSKSAGVIHPMLRNIKWNGNSINIRTIETIVEPLVFFLSGLVLWVLMQNIGMLIMICSFFYSMSYFAAYHQGDEYMLDENDKQICRMSLAETMLEGREPSEDRGFRFYGSLPQDPENRKKLAESFFEEETIEVK